MVPLPENELEVSRLHTEGGVRSAPATAKIIKSKLMMARGNVIPPSLGSGH